MKKDDLKSLITQMYDNLMSNIDNQDDVNKEQVTSYLRDSIDIITSLNDDKIDSIEHAKSAFNNQYQELANKSISSYEYTNQRFERLTQLHEETLSSCTEPMIDVPTITEKFNDIQTHMMDEVQKANDIILQLSNQVATLERDSNLDSLTKVFNRKALSTHLSHLCGHKDLKHELHLLILDIDDFKIINDTYGHVAGDKILIFVANILKKTLRDGDKIFRYGGEEFVIILNRIDAERCQQIASRLLSLVSDNKPIYKGQNINVTISIGGTKYINNDTPDSLIARADKGLYRAKTTGKNKMYSELTDGV